VGGDDGNVNRPREPLRCDAGPVGSGYVDDIGPECLHVAAQSGGQSHAQSILAATGDTHRRNRHERYRRIERRRVRRRRIDPDLGSKAFEIPSETVPTISLATAMAGVIKAMPNAR